MMRKTSLLLLGGAVICSRLLGSVGNELLSKFSTDVLPSRHCRFCRIRA
jgi:hypothetical protein